MTVPCLRRRRQARGAPRGAGVTDLVQDRAVDVGGDDFEGGHAVGEEREPGADPRPAPRGFVGSLVNLNVFEPTDGFERDRGC